MHLIMLEVSWMIQPTLSGISKGSFKDKTSRTLGPNTYTKSISKGVFPISSTQDLPEHLLAIAGSVYALL